MLGASGCIARVAVQVIFPQSRDQLYYLVIWTIIEVFIFYIFFLLMMMTVTNQIPIANSGIDRELYALR